MKTGRTNICILAAFVCLLSAGGLQGCSSAWEAEVNSEENDIVNLYRIQNPELKLASGARFGRPEWIVGDYYFDPFTPISLDFAFSLSCSGEKPSNYEQKHFDEVHKSQLGALQKEYRLDSDKYSETLHVLGPGFFDFSLKSAVTVTSDAVFGGREPGSDLSGLLELIYASRRDRVVCSYPDFKWERNIYGKCGFADYFQAGHALPAPRFVVFAFKEEIVPPDSFSLYLRAEISSDIHKDTVWEAELDYNK